MRLADFFGYAAASVFLLSMFVFVFCFYILTSPIWLTMALWSLHFNKTCCSLKKECKVKE